MSSVVRPRQSVTTDRVRSGQAVTDRHTEQ